ncbi:MAG: FkbM family methyltransferase [bacterium]
MRQKPATLTELITTLPYLSSQHAPGTELHNSWRALARKEAAGKFSAVTGIKRDFAPFGKLIFPYHKMGAIDSVDLFDIEEIIIFSFYWHNRKRYRKVVDAGANIGLHSLVLSRCDYEVRAYEPDLEHVTEIERRLKLNNCANVEIRPVAVSDKAGKAEFIRVLGNTTGSHIKGGKPDPYGELNYIDVRTAPISEIMDWADLVKLDIEGHEDKALLATTLEQWQNTDMLVEIGSEEKARTIFEHLRELGVNMYSQKINWGRVGAVSEMPYSYHDGTLFISLKSAMPWS